MPLLIRTVHRAFPAGSAGCRWVTLGIVLMLRGRSGIPEVGRLVEIARPWRVRTASALRVQIPSFLQFEMRMKSNSERGIVSGKETPSGGADAVQGISELARENCTARLSGISA